MPRAIAPVPDGSPLGPPLAVSVKEMAQLLSIGDKNAYKLTTTPGFPVIHFGSKLLIPYEALQQWVRNNVGNTIELD